MHACITGCILNSGSRREVTRAAALNGGLQATGFPLLQRFLVSVVKHTQSGELLLNDSLSVEPRTGTGELVLQLGRASGTGEL